MEGRISVLMAKAAEKAGMKEIKDQGLVFHSLRKSAVVFLLEADCTDAEVSAITGQTRQMVEHYSKQVNQRRLASEAILKWERNRNRTYGELINNCKTL